MCGVSERFGFPAIAGLLLLAVLLACGGESENGGRPETGDEPGDTASARAGGDTSVDNRTSFAFEQPAENLSDENLERHLEGDVEFGNVFVTAPAPVNPGLGPLFNNVSCESCHIKNGRGHPVFRDSRLRSNALVLISDPDGEPDVPGGNPLVVKPWLHNSSMPQCIACSLCIACSRLPHTVLHSLVIIIATPA